jgi:ribosome-binding protein aMBF1 (putative translation factor)
MELTKKQVVHRVFTMKQKRTTFSDKIRQAIKDTGMSQLSISRAAGIDNGSLNRFVRGKVGIRLTTLDILTEVLGLALVAHRNERKRIKFSDQVRQAVEDSGMSRASISRATGIDEAVLCRFVAGKVGVSTPTLDVLADCLGLKLAERPDAKPKRTEGRA